MKHYTTRREMLRSTGQALAGLGLTRSLTGPAFGQDQGYVTPLAPKPSHGHAKAKSVIFLFMYGGPSQVDTFDYKPKLYGLDGKTIDI